MLSSGEYILGIKTISGTFFFLAILSWNELIFRKEKRFFIPTLVCFIFIFAFILVISLMEIIK